MTKCKKKYDKLVDRAAFIIDFVGNLSARDLKEEGFPNSVIPWCKKNLECVHVGLNNQKTAEG